MNRYADQVQQVWPVYQPISEHVTSCDVNTTNHRHPFREINVPQIDVSGTHDVKLEKSISYVPCARADTPSRLSLHSGQAENDVTSAVFSALHGTLTHDQHNTDGRISCSDSQPEQGTQLRLPTIKTTANVAANMMSEESDMGYASFTDFASLPEVAEDIDRSTESVDMFFDMSSSFSDIIDDVLGVTENIPPSSCDNSPPSSANASFTTYEATVGQCVEHTISSDPVNILYEQKPTLPHENIYATPYMPFNAQTYLMVPYSVSKDKRDVSEYWCVQCNRSFQSKSSLNIHMRSHRGERPHGCPHCGKYFTQKSTLRTHIRTHTGERPYVCQYCSRAFGDYSTFRKHLRVHTGEKPYVCDVCKKGFTQSGNMLRHREVHFKKNLRA